MKHSLGDIEEELEYFTETPASFPGLQKLRLSLNTDFKNYDDSPEKNMPKDIHTDILDILSLDIVLLTNENLEKSSLEYYRPESFLRKSEYIAYDSFKKQTLKNEIDKNMKIKLLKKTEDYTSYLDESFDDIKEEVVHPEGYKVLEKYEITLSDRKLKAFNFEGEAPLSVKDVKFLDNVAIVDDEKYSSYRIDAEDLFVLQVNNDMKAEISFIEEFFKLKK